MQKTVMMLDADGKELEVAFRSTGTTPLRYRGIFGRDLLKEMKENLDGDGTGADGFVSRLAFVMACQAEGREMAALGEADYMEWLDGLDGTALLANAEEVVNVYTASLQTMSVPKKNQGRPSGR